MALWACFIHLRHLLYHLFSRQSFRTIYTWLWQKTKKKYWTKMAAPLLLMWPKATWYCWKSAPCTDSLPSCLCPGHPTFIQLYLNRIASQSSENIRWFGIHTPLFLIKEQCYRRQYVRVCSDLLWYNSNFWYNSKALAVNPKAPSQQGFKKHIPQIMSHFVWTRW